MPETRVVVLACPGREQLTFDTVAALENNGGGHQLPRGQKFLFWNGAPEPPPVPPTWEVVRGRHVDDDGSPSRGERICADAWRAFRWAGACDLVFIEDDVIPCRNAVPYMVAWRSPLLTTFYNPRALPVGPYTIPGSGWFGSQALKLPAAVLARVQVPGAELPPNPRNRPHFGQDVVLSDLMRAWGVQLYQHRSIVQHVGAHSIFTPGAPLTGARAPAPDFPGVDVDAFQLQSGSDAPEQ